MYLSYRARALPQWEELERLLVILKHADTSPTIGSEILSGLLSTGVSDSSKKEGSPSEATRLYKNQLKSRRTLMSAMMKEYVGFNQKVLSVLTADQRIELKAISTKAGSPDHFVRLEDDHKRLRAKESKEKP